MSPANFSTFCSFSLCRSLKTNESRELINYGTSRPERRVYDDWAFFWLYIKELSLIFLRRNRYRWIAERDEQIKKLYQYFYLCMVLRSFIFWNETKGLVVFCVSVCLKLLSAWLKTLQSHVYIFDYYPTARSRVQIMHESRTNIYRFFYSIK